MTAATLAGRAALIVCACAGLAAAASPSDKPAEAQAKAPAYRAIDVPNGGSITGFVKADPPAGKRKMLFVSKDIDQCGERIEDESLLISEDGFLQNAVVSLENITEGVAINRTQRPKLWNRACRFQPHVVAVAVGQKLEIVNGDPILHSTHAKLDGKRTVFNVALPVQNQKVPKTIREPGVLALQCDAGHLWMSGYILAFTHPYFAVTGENGAFRIDRIPPGRYRIRAWHETLGVQTKDVTVEAGKSAEIVFDHLAPTSS